MMLTSPLRTLISPIISMLGGVIIVIGFFLPVFFTVPPSNSNFTNPYPPVMNGWQIISLVFSYHFFNNPFVLLLFIVVIVLCTSLLVLFQKNSLVITRASLLVSFVCIAMLVYFYLFSLLLNWNVSPDSAAASPKFALGPGYRVLLLGLALSAPGMAVSALRRGGIISLIGAFLGSLVGLIIGFSLNFIPWNLIPWSIRESFVSMIGYIDPYPGSMILGSILCGWFFLRRPYRSDSAGR